MSNEDIDLVGFRISEWLKENWSRGELILLLPVKSIISGCNECSLTEEILSPVSPF